MARTPAVEPGFKVLTKDYPANLDDPDDAYWGSGRVFVKPRRENEPLRVGYEFLAARLAAAIGLPTPASEVGQDFEDRQAWVSAVVDLRGEDVAPEDPSVLLAREPDVSAGIFVFDVWTLNSDRHEENVLSHPRLGVWMIDHEKAFGAVHVRNPDALADDDIRNRALTFHLFRDLSLDHASLRAWAERIRQVPRSAIEKAVYEGHVRGLYAAGTRDALVVFLLHRQREVHTLVERSLPEPATPVSDGPGTSEVQGGQRR